MNELNVTEANEFVTEAALREANLTLYPKNTIIIALYGEGATRGKVSELQIAATLNQALGALVLSGVADKCRPFLKAYLLSRYVDLRRQAAGGMQPNLNLGIVKRIPVPLAPLGEQQRITSKLDELFSDLDAGVAALERAQATLKRYRAAVLKAAVEGKLTEQWRVEHRDVEPASELLARIIKERRAKWEAEKLAEFERKGKTPPKGWREKYVEPDRLDATKLPQLPDGWCWCHFGQIASFQNGRAFPSNQYSDDGVKLLRPGNLFADGLVRWTSKNTRKMPQKWADDHPSFLVGEHELVMNLTAQSLADEFLGRVCVTSSGEHCLLNQRLARISASRLLDSRYVLVVLKSRWFRSFVNQLNTGSLIQHMFTSQLTAFPFPVAPQREQCEIVAEVDRHLSLAGETGDLCRKACDRSLRLRQSILKRAFEGVLVPQDPIDEPAIQLLSRIQAQRDAPNAIGQRQRRKSTKAGNG